MPPWELHNVFLTTKKFGKYFIPTSLPFQVASAPVSFLVVDRLLFFYVLLLLVATIVDRVLHFVLIWQRVRERWLVAFNCVLAVDWMLLFCVLSFYLWSVIK